MEYVTIEKGENVLTVTKRVYDIVYADYGYIITGEAVAPVEPVEPERADLSTDETLHNADALSEYVNTVSLTSEATKKASTRGRTGKKDV